MTLELSDLRELGTDAIKQFHDAVAGSNGANDGAIQRLSGKIEYAYGIAARFAKRADELADIEAIWSQMVSLCDETIREVRALGETSNVSVDRILDYRNAAERRRELHS